MTNDRFGSSFVDVDEWRDAPVPHRYVHGGFHDSVARFSFYFPPPERYEGRYVHLIEGGVGGNDATLAAPSAAGGIELAFALGAYTLESNQGHVGLDLSGEPSVMVWEASARSARVARGLATEMYGAEPHHGYVYGGSGGGLRTIACLENAPDLYDGAVPFIAGSTNGGVLPVTMSAVANALRLLWPNFGAIADACEPGGSGNPYEGLDAEQRDALAVLYRCGFPRGAEAQLADHGQALNIWAWDAATLLRTDPGYFADFWTVPGYAGTGNALAASVIEEKTHVQRVLTGRELAAAVDVERAGVGRMMAVAGAGGADVAMAIVADGVELPIRTIGASFTFTTGAAAGRRLYCIGAVGDASDELRDQWSDLRRRQRRRRARDRQSGLARLLLLPPPPGARRQPCDAPVRRRREAGVPTAAALPHDGAAIDDACRRPLRPVRGEDDRRTEHLRRLRVAACRPHVRAPRARRARRSLR